METAKHTDKWLVGKSTIYKLNVLGENRIAANFHPGRDDSDERVSTEECEREAKKAAIACNSHAALVEALRFVNDGPIASEGGNAPEQMLMWAAKARQKAQDALCSAGVLPQDDDQRAPNGRRV